MKRFLQYLLLLLFVLPLGGMSDSCATTKKKTTPTYKTSSKQRKAVATTKKSGNRTKNSGYKSKSYGKSSKYGSKQKTANNKYSKKGKSSRKNGWNAAAVEKPVSYNYGRGPKAQLNTRPTVQRIVTRKRGRRIVQYKQVFQPPISVTYTGIDISHHQHQINWLEVASLGSEFAYIKATEGESFRDSLYEINISRARAAGLKVGSYLYFHPDMSAKRQFENFRDVVREDYQDLLPMIDIEETGTMNRRLLMARLNELLDLMTDYYGQKPTIYTATSFYNSYLQNALADYPLIVGGYTRKPVLLDGKDYVVWQFSSHGKVNGISGNVDLDVYNKGYSLDDIKFDRSKVKGVKIHRIPMSMTSTPTVNKQQQVNLPKSKPVPVEDKKKPIKQVVKSVKTVKKKVVPATKKVNVESKKQSSSSIAE